ncbi:hypothetical protein GWK16_09070 [Roseomonas sp. JC162]|uniref:Uncharacterized protein n=1 Tax=Neoroseomonas marina TaxID=1232220 RepID=A0A848ED01_9PROT|nr:hypothetical protein [Neoroseomonas marina]NMJ41389.1 hypothetical protein [Neoroseomonas marina]
METTIPRIPSQADRGTEVEIYWKACAAIRDGETAVGIADLLPLTWSRSSILRERVRQVLAKHGAAIH